MIDLTTVDLTNTIDIHVHVSPDIVSRKMDGLELARQAASRGMKAVLIKSHWTLTADQAYLIEQQFSNLRVFGGLALNHTVGGLNPAAVEAALRMGAVQIWMPTLSSMAEPAPLFGPGISILENGRPIKPLYDILRLIAEHDAILGTGHLPTAEIMALVPLAYQLGVKKILITHPEHPPVELPLEQQEALRDQFDVFFERCLITTTFGGGDMPFETLAGAIRRVGPETTIISTDFGQAMNPTPLDGLAYYIRQLGDSGFSKDDIGRMSQENPADLLGL